LVAMIGLTQRAEVDLQASCPDRRREGIDECGTVGRRLRGQHGVQVLLHPIRVGGVPGGQRHRRIAIAARGQTDHRLRRAGGSGSAAAHPLSAPCPGNLRRNLEKSEDIYIYPGQTRKLDQNKRGGGPLHGHITPSGVHITPSGVATPRPRSGTHPRPGSRPGRWLRPSRRQ
jgi:hypothetical protein